MKAPTAAVELISATREEGDKWKIELQMQQQNSTTLIEQATKWITALEEFHFVQIAS